MGVRDRKTFFLNCSVNHFGRLVFDQPLASACWSTDRSPSAQTADLLETGIKLQHDGVIAYIAENRFNVMDQR